jgi:hypothetical protein
MPGTVRYLTQPASSHPEGYLALAPKVHRRSRAAASDGPRGTVARTAFRGITEDGEARPRCRESVQCQGFPAPGTAGGETDLGKQNTEEEERT